MLNKLINKINTRFYEVLHKIKDVQMLNEIELNRLVVGGEPNKRRKNTLIRRKESRSCVIRMLQG
jgi:hypothetical protein